MINKFYIIDGDASDELVFINQPLADVLASVEASTHWLYIKPVGKTGSAVRSRDQFIEYLRSLRESVEDMEVVAYLHKTGSRLAELDELLS